MRRSSKSNVGMEEKTSKPGPQRPLTKGSSVEILSKVKANQRRRGERAERRGKRLKIVQQSESAYINATMTKAPKRSRLVNRWMAGRI